MENKIIKAALEALTAEPRCTAPNHNIVPRLSRHTDETGSGLIVEIVCETCNGFYGVVHPKSALELAGPNSDVGRQILEAFPDWRNEPPTELTDIMKVVEKNG